MAFIQTVRRPALTETGTQDFTFPGFGTPKAAVFIASFATTNDTPADGGALSYGAATAADERWVVFMRDNHGATPATSCTSGRGAGNVINIDRPAPTADATADFDSFITDGVRIEWTAAADEAFLVTVILIGGDDVEAYAGNKALGDTVDLATDITDPGFRPHLLLTATGDGGAGGVEVSFGVVHDDGAGNVTQRCLASFVDSGEGDAQPNLQFREDYGAAALQGNGTLDWAAEFGGFDANGFTVTTRNAGANDATLLYLALRFASADEVAVGTYTTPTSTGEHSQAGLGFQPRFLMLGMTLAEAAATAYNNDPLAGSYGLAAAAPSAAYATSYSGEDGAMPTNTQSLSANTAVELPQDDGADGLRANMSSFDSAGFTLDYDNVLAAGKKFWYLALAGEELPGTPVTLNPVSVCGYVRTLVGDRTGALLAELQIALESVSWRLNGIGAAAFSIAKSDAKAVEDYLRFGNRVLFQFGNGLPDWGGIVDTPRAWSSGRIDVTCYSAEYLLGLRVTAKNLVFTGASAGAIYQETISQANAVAATGLSLGNIWLGGDSFTIEYHREKLDEVAQELVEKLSGADFAVIPSLEAGRIVFTAEFYQRRGADKSAGVALLQGHNIAAGMGLEEQGEIVNSYYLVGAGNEWPDRIEANAQDSASVGEYGLREAARIDGRFTVQEHMDPVAAHEISQTAQPHNLFSLEAVNLAPAAFAAYDVGDSVGLWAYGYGFAGTVTAVHVQGRAYLPRRGTCELVVREVAA